MTSFFLSSRQNPSRYPQPFDCRHDNHRPLISHDDNYMSSFSCYEKTRHGTPHIMESGIFNQECCWIADLRVGNSVVAAGTSCTAGERRHKNHVLMVLTKKKEPLLFVHRRRSLGPGTSNGQEILRKKTRTNFSTPT